MANQLGSSFTPMVPHSWYGQVSATRIKTPGSSTAATLVKGSPGHVNGIVLSNNAASARYVKFYDKAASPTVGTDVPLFTVILEQSIVPAAIHIGQGIPFTNGIAFAITTGVADTDTGQPAADDVHG